MLHPDACVAAIRCHNWLVLVNSAVMAHRQRDVRCGRGHASEKPELPAALAETASSIRFLGPPAPAMAALGDKARPFGWHP